MLTKGRKRYRYSRCAAYWLTCPRVEKKPGFCNKNPARGGFFGFYWFFLGFIGFFGFF
jgi:hypothetical protein